MEKVRMLTQFDQHQKGDIVEVDLMRSRYWQATGVAEPIREKEDKTVYQTKEDKETKIRRTKNG